MWAVLLFCSNVLDDVLAVLYIRRVSEGKYVQAAGYSGLLTLIVAFSVKLYVESTAYLLPVVVGSAIGAALGTWWDQSTKRRRKV
jgi:hypothetical protein